MDPLLAKSIAATCGATLTALTMTPFDVVKTRLQTQTAHKPTLGALQTCRHAPHLPCARSMSSYAASLNPTASTSTANVGMSSPRGIASNFFMRHGTRQLPEDLCVCFYEGGAMKAQRVTGFWDAAIQVARHEGIRGLWKGVGTSLLIAVPSQSVYMITYDHLLNKTLPSIIPSSFMTPLLSGIAARTIISTIASPLELLRTTLQSTPLHPSKPHTYASVLASARDLVQTKGLVSLWRGLIPTLWRDVPFSGIYWASYEAWKLTFRTKFNRKGTLYEFLSGAASGVTAATLTHPFDVAKTRRQALLLSQDGAPTQTMQFLARILKQEGTGALYAGIVPRLAKIAPACGIMIASYETIGRYLLEPEEQ